MSVDIAVIGAGMAGCLTAYLLRETGAEVAVLEAARIGSGQSQNTTAKITSQHGLIYQRLVTQLGPRLAGMYAQANQRAVGQYKTLVQELGADCGWQEQPAYLYTTTDPEALRREWSAAVRLGLPARLTTATPLPFPVAQALRFDGQAQFDPLRFLNALSERLTVYEHTPVRRAEGHTLWTDRGRVTAGKVVFACHFPFVNVPGLYFARMHQARSYVLALENAGPVAGMHFGIDANGLSFRMAGPLLLLGGGEHRTGENETGGRYERLRRMARTWWPDCRETARWSAQDCIPQDGVPFIGRFAASRPDWYVATGFQKWGMTTAMAAAYILRDLLLGRENEFAPVFTPQRLRLRASFGTMLADGLVTVKGLTRSCFSMPRDSAQDIPPGHGGVVNASGRKAGLYRDDAGGEHLVSVRCPHLGCEMRWNADERTWDCPCHGSRFDADGALLTGPAQKDAKLQT